MIPRLFVTLAAALVALAICAPLVFGHAELVQSDPEDGGTLTTTPYTMTLTYDEPLDPEASSVVVRDSSGAEVASGGLSDQDETRMIVELPELAPGEYTVRWTAVTPDDNGVERGTLTFTVAEVAATPAPTAAPTTAPTAAATPVATAAPAATSAPTPTPEPTEPAPSGSNDLLIALLVAGVAVAGVLGYLFLRNRR